MTGYNKCIFIGNLTSDPELRHTQSGKSVANFSIACNETWVTDGEKRDNVEYVRVVAWGKLAEICDQYLSKGRPAMVEGRMATREWEDRDGNKKFTTEIIASKVIFLGGGKGEKKEDDNRGNGPPLDDDYPF
jgi:single-strand DNA-binding protein